MYSRDEIKEQLDSMVIHAGGDSIIGASEDSRLREDLGLTSIVMLYMVIAIEEKFSISFEDADFYDFKTLKDIVDYIEKTRRFCNE